jgi:5-methylcytosine-specific restriction endonuclease McrA
VEFILIFFGVVVVGLVLAAFVEALKLLFRLIDWVAEVFGVMVGEAIEIIALLFQIALVIIAFPFELVGAIITTLFDQDPPAKPEPSKGRITMRWDDLQPLDVGHSPPPQPESRYTPDWSSVSRRYKEARYWTCEGCGVYCGGDGDQSLLHVHHLDLDSMNNAEWNLKALCVQCHGSMPGVGHKRLASASKTDGRWQAIDYLRWRQRNRR